MTCAGARRDRPALLLYGRQDVRATWALYKALRAVSTSDTPSLRSRTSAANPSTGTLHGASCIPARALPSNICACSGLRRCYISARHFSRKLWATRSPRTSAAGPTCAYARRTCRCACSTLRRSTRRIFCLQRLDKTARRPVDRDQARHPLGEGPPHPFRSPQWACCTTPRPGRSSTAWCWSTRTGRSYRSASAQGQRSVHDRRYAAADAGRALVHIGAM